MKMSQPEPKNDKDATASDGINASAKTPPASLSPEEDQLRELNEKITGLTKTNRQLKRKIFDLYTSFEISRHFNSVLDHETLLDTFILTSLAQVGASKGAVFLPRRGQPDRLVMTKGKGSGEFPDMRQFFRIKSKLVTYLTGLNRPLPTGELLAETVGRGERNILERFHPGLVVPLIYQTRLIGIFIITDKMSGREFKMEDIEFLSVLGSQISVAIENTRLYEAEKMATRQLRLAQEQLVRSERQAALGEMSAKIAHEINNPLGIIKNYIQLISRSVGPNVEATNYSRIVGQEIDRIARIVRELLNVHRPRAMVRESIDITRVIEDVLLLMEKRLELQKVSVVRSFPPECSPISGSPENLKQVFLNLIINACDAMSEGGTLDLSVEDRSDTLHLEVRDTGPGIKAEEIPRIFELFYTTKDPGKGTGLGLSVCYGIIKTHGGSISYRNTDSGGCFSIELPTINEDTNHEPGC